MASENTLEKAENHLCNYEEPVFRPVDYHNYYHFLSTVDREEIQETVARYESRQRGPMQGILSAIVVILYIVIAGVWTVLVKGMVRSGETGNIGTVTLLAIAFTVVLSVILILLYNRKVNRRYKILIMRDFLEDEKEGEKWKKKI